MADLSKAPRATRTVAILTRAAAQTHRLAIIRKIQEAGFSLLEEHMEEWRLPDDEDFLGEFLACEADERKWTNRLTGTPIYVMVLERQSAVSMWLEMIGPDAPNATQGLRTEHGADCFYGSPSAIGAERQVAICFPELANEEGETSSQAPSSSSSGLQSGGPFRARPVPASIAAPAIQPRLSRAAALRMGVELPKTPKREEAPAPQGPVGISGLPKTEIALPKSLSKPVVAPRLNKAASARINGAGSEHTPPPAGARERVAVDFSNTPGHKRASIGVTLASLQAPSIAPRTNKAAAARISGVGAGVSGADTPARTPARAPSAFSPLPRASNAMTRSVSISSQSSSTSGMRERKEVDFSNTPGHKRSISAAQRPASLRAPAVEPRLNKAAAARTGRPSTADASNKENTSPARPGSRPSLGSGAGVDFSNTPGHRRASIVGMPALASLKAPSIVPRTNAAAAARIAAVSGGPAPQSTSPSRPASRAGSAMGQRPGSALGQRAGSAMGSYGPHSVSPAKLRAGTAGSGTGAASPMQRPLRAKAPPSAYRHSIAFSSPSPTAASQG